MNQIICYQHEITDQILTINDDLRFKHISLVLKKKPKDTINICILDKARYTGTILKINKTSISILLDNKCTDSLPGQYDLILGACRPPTLKKVLEHGSTIGFKNFYLFKAEKSEKSYLQSNLYTDLGSRPYRELGIAQSNKYFELPRIHVFKTLQDLLSSITTNQYGQKILLSISATHKLAPIEPPPVKTLIAIGPERDWVQHEEKSLMQAGLQPIKISKSILRIEYALAYAAAQVEYLHMGEDSFLNN